MIQYVCDACKTVSTEQYQRGRNKRYVEYLNGVQLDEWMGDLCESCFKRVEHEMGNAAIRTIISIRKNAENGENEEDG